MSDFLQLLGSWFEPLANAIKPLAPWQAALFTVVVVCVPLIFWQLTKLKQIKREAKYGNLNESELKLNQQSDADVKIIKTGDLNNSKVEFNQ